MRRYARGQRPQAVAFSHTYLVLRVGRQLLTGAGVDGVPLTDVVGEAHEGLVQLVRRDQMRAVDQVVPDLRVLGQPRAVVL